MTHAPIDSKLEELVHRVIGAIIEVHKLLGPGHLEAHYLAALCHELTLLGIAFRREVPIELNYKGKRIGEGRLDLLVEEQLILEVKAVEHLANVHVAQLMSYLRITGRRLGLLVNFNVPAMNSPNAIRRVIVG